MYVNFDFYDYTDGILDAKNSDLCPDTITTVNHAVLAVGFKIDLNNPEESYIKFKN